jgi:hypothetical protein
MAIPSIKLLSVMGAASARLVPFFVEHYRGLGVQEFCITLHYDVGQEQGRDLALAHLRSAGIEPINVWHGHFVHETKEQYLGSMRADHSENGNWWVYADTDEFHEFPVRLGVMREECERKGKTYVMGRWIDRVADDGALLEIDVSQDLYAQFPWATHLSLSLGGKSFDATTKLCFVAPDVYPSNSGFHRPKDRNWRDDPLCWPGLIACNHFKWDHSVRQRLKCRVAEWEDVPNSVREATNVEEHLVGNEDRIDLENVQPRLRLTDGTRLRRGIYRAIRGVRYSVLSKLLRRTVEATSGGPKALERRRGIYR